MRMDVIELKDRSRINSHSMMQGGGTIEEDYEVAALSLVLKHETVKSNVLGGLNVPFVYTDDLKWNESFSFDINDIESSYTTSRHNRNDSFDTSRNSFKSIQSIQSTKTARYTMVTAGDESLDIENGYKIDHYTIIGEEEKV